MHTSEKPLEKLSIQLDSKCASTLREKNHNWKGGRIRRRGYIYVLCKGHPLANSKGYVREHRLVMEQFLGRYIPRGLDVHHISGVKDDNRIENLVLLTHSEHMSLERRKDMTGWRCSECGGKTPFRKPSSRHPNGRYVWQYRKGHRYDLSQLLCDSCYKREWYRLKKEKKKEAMK